MPSQTTPCVQMYIFVCLFVYSVCDGAKWSCVTENCPAYCSILGRFHGYINTFDGSHGVFKGRGNYILVETTKEASKAEPHTAFKIELDLQNIDPENPPLTESAGILGIQFGKHNKKYK